MMPWSVSLLGRDFKRLHQHLFRPDHDEHAAFLFAGLDASRQRLLVRRVVAVADDDFGTSTRGAYRAVSARAVARAARKCSDEGLALIWAHSHPRATDSVGLSADDRESHERMHPHLIEITGDRPVGGLVFGERSAAGEIWLPGGRVADVGAVRILGAHLRDLTPHRTLTADAPERFARQALLFGAHGQALLKRLTVVVAGAGGGGSLIVQSLAHLGVGRIIVIDFDRVSTSNLSRMVGAGSRDIGRLKIDVLARLVADIDPNIEYEGVPGDITYETDARRLAEGDFAFLATDTVHARFAFNAVCQQYLVPGIQVGSKVSVNPETGSVDLVHVMERPLTLDRPCLLCGGAISRDQLRREQLSDAERQAQDYVGNGDGPEVQDPSVITLNSISTALATTDFLFMVTGLLARGADLGHRAYYPEERRLARRRIQPEDSCRFCDADANYSLFGAGDYGALPLRPGHRPHSPGPGPVEPVASRTGGDAVTAARPTRLHRLRLRLSDALRS